MFGPTTAARKSQVQIILTSYWTKHRTVLLTRNGMLVFLLRVVAECNKARKNLSIATSTAKAKDPITSGQWRVYRVHKSIATLQKAHTRRKKA
ncbi:hypothetical protein NSND_61179 [Nitrospira sp. ND1]|nr:hypothetical protein NSND_61179 [Nitrospira sp. ND1]